MKLFWITLCITISGLANPAFSQQQKNEIPTDHTLRVFLDGEVEDFSYLRRNIKFVDFVNDPKLADIQVIATRVHLGNGGRKYFLNFYSGKTRDNIDFTLNFVRDPNDTDDMIRIRFSKTLQIGLLNYLSTTHTLDQIDIAFKPDKTDEVQKVDPLNDPWNFWVFRLTTSGGFNVEESKHRYSYSGSFRADRITEKWLIKNYMEHENSTRTYKKSESEIYHSINITDQASSRIIYGFTDHLSVGLFLNTARSTYMNTNLFLAAKPAIEYNFFKWKDADRKIFTLAYYIGPSYYKYRDTTFLNRMEDRLWEHNLSCALELVQPWGEVYAQLGYEGYLNDLQNYNLSAEADISVRVTKGVSVNFEFSAESIHNQLFLPRNEVSLEELLLNSRKLPTSFQLSGKIGLRFYFGSMYNNIVNERF